MASKDKSLVSFKVIIEGKLIQEKYSVVDLKINKQVNRIATAKIKLLDGSVAKERFQISTGEEFVPGKEIEIQAGFGLKTASIYKGIIFSQSIQYRNHCGSMLIVECLDEATKLKGSQNTQAYTEKTDSDIWQTITSKYNLSTEIESTDNTFSQFIQYNATDWNFLLSRAEVNGRVIVATDNKLKICKPKVDSSPIDTLTFGQNVIEFNTKMNAQNQLSKVSAKSWDYKKQALVEASASSPTVPAQGNISGDTLSDVSNSTTFSLLTTVFVEEATLKTWADSRLLKSRLAKIRGDIKVFGNSAYQPNTIVKLVGMGPRFNGNAYVSGVMHQLEKGNWWSHLTIGMDPEWIAKTANISARPASGLLPGINGLQNGVVKQIDEDPKNETRIKVKVPIFQNSEENYVWARWVQPYATAGAGQFFMPEIEDEVILGFLNDDPRFPIVLGSLYSSTKAPPYPPTNENPIKAIVTKNKLKIEFNDDKKVITVITPGENKFILDDDEGSITLADQNGNKLTMDSGGINLSSAADIKITADGEVEISGSSGVKVSSEATISVEAEASLSISGLDVSISGEMSLEASGGAEASLKADGELAITGALVKIN